MIATLGCDVKSLALSPLDLHFTSCRGTEPWYSLNRVRDVHLYNVGPGVMAYLTCAIICLELGGECVFILLFNIIIIHDTHYY